MNRSADSFGVHKLVSVLRTKFTSTETIKQAVIADTGISFLSAHTVNMELNRMGRRARHRGFSVMLNWYLLQHRHNKRLPAVEMAFKQFLSLTKGGAKTSVITYIG